MSPVPPFRIWCSIAVAGVSLLLTSASAVAEIARGNPAARLLAGKFASEHWELTARFDSGHLLFAEFIITNIGFGDRNAAATGYLVEPNGKLHRFRNGRREGNWTLAQNRLHIIIGASQLDLSRLPYRLFVDKRHLRIDLSFRPNNQAAWSGELAPSGYTLDLLDAAAPIAGTVWIQGMGQAMTLSGVAAFTHSWMNELGSNVILRRIEFFSLLKEYPLYSVDIASPDGTRTRWVIMRPKDTEAQESQRFIFSLTGEAKGKADRGYPVPQVLSLQNRDIEGQVQLARIVLRYNPLGDLPQPFRFFVSLLLNLRPLRVWALSPFAVTLRPEESPEARDFLSFQGTGVVAITFLNPVPASLSHSMARVFEVPGADWCAEQSACES